MIICVCHRISDRDIAREAAQGCADFEALQDELRVGTACGACVGHAQDCLARCTRHALPHGGDARRLAEAA